MKRIISALLLTLVLSSGYSQVISRVGVVDLSKIFSQYFRESVSFRKIEELQTTYEEERRNIINQIDKLKEDKLNAQRNSNESLVLRIEKQIDEKQEYLKDYHSVMTNRINRLKESMQASSSLSSEILQAIGYVAEQEGYAVIYKAQDPNILFFSKDADITDLVIQRLMRNAGG
ncbi:OmpH family outer membrane protein [Marispirochaeta aestuarii]|uniref:OmpH family outer membrane protein n=1 Tax=Marispirochaeta aestuarii TaxID=1963862 RepID=UPI002ABD3908|nr:OmpH family outer membrane protein [Marispirochaeta aestuarii]